MNPSAGRLNGWFCALPLVLLGLSPAAGRPTPALAGDGAGTDRAVVQFWVERLRHEPESEWRLAAECLAIVGAPAVPALLELAPSADSPLAPRALYALSSMGREARAGARALPRFLKSKDPASRSKAAEILGGIGPEAESQVPALVARVGDPSPDAAVAAIDAIGSIGRGTPETLKALEKALSDDDPRIRTASARTLGRLGTTATSTLRRAAEGAPTRIGALEAAEILVRRATRDPDDVEAVDLFLRGLAADDAIGRVVHRVLAETVEYPALFLRGLGHASEAVRAESAQRLADCRWSMPSDERLLAATVAALKGSVFDPAERVRRESLRTLGHLSSFARDAVPAVRQALLDPSLEVRVAAAVTLGRLGAWSREVKSALEDVLGSPNPAERAEAIAAVVSIGPEAAAVLPALKSAVARAGGLDRAHLFDAIGSVGPEGAPLLIAGLEDRDEDVRRAAIANLGKMAASPDVAIEALARELDGKGIALREEAVRSLFRLGPAGATAVVRSLIAGLRLPASSEVLWGEPPPQVDPALLLSALVSRRSPAAHDVALRLLPLQGAAAVEPLVAAALERLPIERVEMYAILAAIGTPAHEALRTFLRAADAGDRERLVDVLDGSDASLALLKGLLVDADAGIRYLAARRVLRLALVPESGLVPEPSSRENAGLPPEGDDDRSPGSASRASGASGRTAVAQRRTRFRILLRDAALRLALDWKSGDAGRDELRVADLAHRVPYPQLLPLMTAALREGAVRDNEVLVAYWREIGLEGWPALLEAVADPATAIRAANVLRRLGPRAAGCVPALRERLTGPEPAVRAGAAIAIAGLLPREARAVLRELSEALRGDPETSAAALDVLRGAGPIAAPAAHDIVEAARSARVPRRSAARALREIGADRGEAVAAFVKDLGAGNPEDRDDALVALALLGDSRREVVDALVRAAESCDSSRGQEAIRALASIGPGAGAAVPSLLACWIRTKRSDPHLQALLAVGEAAVPALIGAMSHPTNRPFAATVLGRLGAIALPALSKALPDAPPEVRPFLVHAIGAAGPPARALVAALEAQAKSAEEPTKFEAALALLRIGEGYEAAVPELIAWIDHVPYYERGVLGVERAEGPDARTEVIEAIGDLGARGAEFAPMLALLANPSRVGASLREPARSIPVDLAIAEAAAVSLGRLGSTSPGIVEALRRWLHVSPEEAAGARFIRFRSACALARLAPGDDASIAAVVAEPLDPRFFVDADPRVEGMEHGRLESRADVLPAALRTLGGLGARAVPYVRAVAGRLRDPDPGVRVEAARALAALASLASLAVDALPEVEEALFDESEAVRLAAGAAAKALHEKPR